RHARAIGQPDRSCHARHGAERTRPRAAPHVGDELRLAPSLRHHPEQRRHPLRLEILQHPLRHDEPPPRRTGHHPLDAPLASGRPRSRQPPPPPFFSSVSTCFATAFNVSNTPTPVRAHASCSGTFVGFKSSCNSATSAMLGRSRLLYWMTYGSLSRS